MDRPKRATSHQKFYKVSLQKNIKREPIDFVDSEDFSSQDDVLNLKEETPATSTKFICYDWDKENNTDFLCETVHFQEKKGKYSQKSCNRKDSEDFSSQGNVLNLKEETPATSTKFICYDWDKENNTDFLCKTVNFQEKKEKYSQKSCNKKVASLTFANDDGLTSLSKSSSSKHHLSLNESHNETGESSLNCTKNGGKNSLKDLDSILNSESNQIQQHYDDSKCGEGSSSGFNLTSNNSKLKCKFCIHVSKDENNLYEHVMSHMNMTCFTCPLCPYATKRRSNFLQHSIKHSEERPYKCNICSFAAKLPFVLRRHYKVHNSTKQFSCNQCQYSGKFECALKKHRKGHDFSAPYRCGKCSFSSVIKKVVVDHMRGHHVKKETDA